MSNQNKQNKGWEETFDKQFGVIYKTTSGKPYSTGGLKGVSNIYYEGINYEMKNYIRHLLTKELALQKKKIIEEVENMGEVYKEGSTYHNAECVTKNEIIEIIKNSKSITS